MAGARYLVHARLARTESRQGKDYLGTQRPGGSIKRSSQRLAPLVIFGDQVELRQRSIPGSQGRAHAQIAERTGCTPWELSSAGNRVS